MFKDIDQFLTICSIIFLHWTTPIIFLSFLKWTFDIEFTSTFAYGCYLASGLIIIFKVIESLMSEKGEKLGKKWRDQIVIVTGGSQGLGKTLALALMLQGATVAVLDVVPLDADMERVYFYECDVSNLKQVETTIEKITDDLGTPTILINNAGIFKEATEFAKTSWKDIKKTVDVNLLGSMLVTHQVLPLFLENGQGHIVNMSSSLGFASPALSSAYTATKSGLIAFHESLHNELTTFHSSKNIKTTLVCPGKLAETQLFQNAKLRFKWIFPEVEVMELSWMIVRELELNRHGEIFVPTYAHWMVLSRVFPLKFRRWVFNFLGANTSLVGSDELD